MDLKQLDKPEENASQSTIEEGEIVVSLSGCGACALTFSIAEGC